MKNTLYTIIALFICGIASGQETIIQVDQGPNYSQTVYLNLEDLDTTIVDFTTWDIAFSGSARSVGILINEAAISGEGSSPIELYLTSSTNFDDVDISQVQDTLYNGDDSYTDGAFNQPADTSNQFDFGWGEYNPATHFVVGTKIFIIKLRDASYKKIRIDQYAGSQYTFTYADLNGENLVTDSIDIADFEGKALAYYSIRDQKTLDLEPENWDLKFTRYITSLLAEPGVYLDYHVVGTLTKPGVEVAVASNIDPANVEFEDYADSLTTDIDAIGHEWKYFDLNTFVYSIVENQVFFVKTPKNEIYKIQFLDFEGSSTGISTLKITYIETLSALAKPQEYISQSTVFPNPALGGQAKIKFHSDQFRQNARLLVHNSVGQQVYLRNVSITQGENVHSLPHISVPGLYYVTLRTEDGVSTLRLINN